MSKKGASTAKYEMKQIIAQREITYKRNDREFRFYVYIGAPLPRALIEKDAQDWYCPLKVPGLDNRVHVAFGIDSVQALHHALALAGHIINDSIPGRMGLLSWYGSTDLGFPQTVKVPSKSELKGKLKSKKAYKAQPRSHRSRKTPK